jgi:hypothetical protein
VAIAASGRWATATCARPGADRPGRRLILHGDKDASAPLEITGRRFAAGIQGAS